MINVDEKIVDLVDLHVNDTGLFLLKITKLMDRINNLSELLIDQKEAGEISAQLYQLAKVVEDYSNKFCMFGEMFKGRIDA